MDILLVTHPYLRIQRLTSPRRYWNRDKRALKFFVGFLLYVVLLDPARPSCNVLISVMTTLDTITCVYAIYWWDVNTHTVLYVLIIVGTWSWISAMSKAWVTTCGESTRFRATGSFLICTSGRWTYVTLNYLISITTHAATWCRSRSFSVYVFHSIICHVLTEDCCRPSPALPWKCSSFALSLTCDCLNAA